MKENDQFTWKQRLRWPAAPDLAVALLIVGYAAFFSAFTLAQHRAFLTLGFDLGNVDQAVWSTTQGRILAYTNWPGETIRFGNHFEPILLLVSLSYFFHSGPEALLVLQSVVLALGAWPIYRLTARRLENDWMGVLFALVYLLFPGLEAANVFDFHAVALAPTFLAWALWSLEERRYGRFAVWGLLAMACKEEMPLVVAMMGLWLLVRGQRRLGGATAAAGVTWTALAMLVIIPGFNTLNINPHLARDNPLGQNSQDVCPTCTEFASQMWLFGHLGEDPQEMLVNLVTRPGLYVSTLTEPPKVRYLLKLFFPTGYLALLAPQVMVLAAPSLAVNLLSARPHMTVLDTFHYTAPIAPFLMVASAYGLALVVRGMGRVFRHVDRRFLLAVLGCYVLILSLFYHRANGKTPLTRRFAWPQVGKHEQIGHALIAQIPPDAAVSAQNQLNPHLTQRAKVHIFPWLADAEYVLVDVTSYPYFEPVEKFHAAVHDVLADPEFGVVAASDGYILFRRGTGSQELPDAFYTPFQVPGDPGQHIPRATFGTGPALADVTWHLEKDTELVIETIWLRGTEPAVSGQMVVELIQSPSEWQAAEEQVLTLARWHPPQEWQDGQPVRDVVRLTPPGGAPLDTWQIGLIYRLPSGEKLPVTPAEGSGWRVDESGTMLLVPLEPATN